MALIWVPPSSLFCVQCPASLPYSCARSGTTRSSSSSIYRKSSFPAAATTTISSSSSTPPSSSSSDEEIAWKREEERWQREEQRWLREESRWLRQEQRWNAERQALISEIAALRHQIGHLLQQQQEQKNTKTTIMNYGSEEDEDAIAVGILNAAASTSSLGNVFALPANLENPQQQSASEQKEQVEVKQRKPTTGTGTDQPSPTKRRTLRFGSEGDDVKHMQEALARLGFYSGEEDMEFSSFQSATESAVKTWQATLGLSENGLMTQELLNKLFGDEALQNGDLDKASLSLSMSFANKQSNGATHMAAVSQVAEVQQSIKAERQGFEMSERRVYLLGENRWEEPQRLTDCKQGIKTVDTKKCFSCRGEGKMMCTECGGSGDLNVEEQFLDWAENAKCPYCEGSGYLVCDVCEGKG